MNRTMLATFSNTTQLGALAMFWWLAAGLAAAQTRELEEEETELPSGVSALGGAVGGERSKPLYSTLRSKVELQFGEVRNPQA